MSKRLGSSAFELLASPLDRVVAQASAEPSRWRSSTSHERSNPSRRGVLMGMTAISVNLATSGWAGKAVAASNSSRPYWSFARDVFVDLVSWFIREALPFHPFEIKSKDVKSSEAAQPGGTQFHNSFACIHQIHKSIEIVRTRYEFFLGLDDDGFLRAHTDENIPDAKDLNGAELRRIRHIHKKNEKLLLFPCGPRESPNEPEKMNFSSHCKRSGLKREEWDLMYCRNINDGKHLYRGYAIKKKGIGSDRLDGATDLLIDDND
ncbi:hypothetical protein [Archangium sp.]|uniref:hypothetical protein n=1 Tax=Archangium sp. TaxID=1872627 RepID=UPI002D2D225B|nr:hypothetical protein [Archangium sp.]HYO53814.1 hypothetical protein [Archangium sp.]